MRRSESLRTSSRERRRRGSQRHGMVPLIELPEDLKPAFSYLRDTPLRFLHPIRAIGDKLLERGRICFVTERSLNVASCSGGVCRRCKLSDIAEVALDEERRILSVASRNTLATHDAAHEAESGFVLVLPTRNAFDALISALQHAHHTNTGEVLRTRPLTSLQRLPSQLLRTLESKRIERSNSDAGSYSRRPLRPHSPGSRPVPIMASADARPRVSASTPHEDHSEKHAADDSYEAAASSFHRKATSSRRPSYKGSGSDSHTGHAVEFSPHHPIPLPHFLNTSLPSSVEATRQSSGLSSNTRGSPGQVHRSAHNNRCVAHHVDIGTQGGTESPRLLECSKHSVDSEHPEWLATKFQRRNSSYRSVYSSREGPLSRQPWSHAVYTTRGKRASTPGESCKGREVQRRGAGDDPVPPARVERSQLKSPLVSQAPQQQWSSQGGCSGLASDDHVTQIRYELHSVRLEHQRLKAVLLRFYDALPQAVRHELDRSSFREGEATSTRSLDAAQQELAEELCRLQKAVHRDRAEWQKEREAYELRLRHGRQ